MIALLLAQAYLMSPMQDGGYIATPLYNRVPIQEVPYATRLLQNTAIGNPSVTSQYEYPSDQNGYPLKTTRYGQPTVPIQEQVANQEIQGQLQQQQLQNSTMQLNLALNQKKDQYQTKVNEQALQATQQLGQFDPHSPDFEAKFTEFQKANPLAFQNPGFRQLASNLVSTRAQFVHDDSMTNRANQSLQAHTQATEAAYQERLLNEHRSKAAQYGLSADYDEALKQNPTDPIAAYSAIAPKIADTKAKQQHSKIDTRPQTFAEFQNIQAHQRALTGNGKNTYDDLSPAEKSEYDYNQKVMQEYMSAHPAGPSSSPSSASSVPVDQATKQPVSFFLPKPLSTPAPASK